MGRKGRNQGDLSTGNYSKGSNLSSYIKRISDTSFSRVDVPADKSQRERRPLLNIPRLRSLLDSHIKDQNDKHIQLDTPFRMPDLNAYHFQQQHMKKLEDARVWDGELFSNLIAEFSPAQTLQKLCLLKIAQQFNYLSNDQLHCLASMPAPILSLLSLYLIRSNALTNHALKWIATIRPAISEICIPPSCTCLPEVLNTSSPTSHLSVNSYAECWEDVDWDNPFAVMLPHVQPFSATLVKMHIIGLKFNCLLNLGAICTSLEHLTIHRLLSPQQCRSWLVDILFPADWGSSNGNSNPSTVYFPCLTSLHISHCLPHHEIAAQAFEEFALQLFITRNIGKANMHFPKLAHVRISPPLANPDYLIAQFRKADVTLSF